MATPYGAPPTMVDTELAGVPRGAELNAAVQMRRAERSPMASPPTRPPIDRSSGAYTMTWGDFQQRHPEWKGDYWAECRALYAGGQRLLADQNVLERLFPKHLHEDPLVYQQRKARAHYFPYPGTIIDHLLAGLGTDPLKVSFVEVDEDGTAAPAPAGAEWWEQWVDDVTDDAERPADYGLETDDDENDDEGGCSLHSFLVDVMREALQTRCAWVLADLPAVDPEDVELMTSQLDAERAGVTDPYLCIVPTEQVIDWQTDKRGRLQWAMMMTCEQLRPSPAVRRNKLLYTYTIWDATTWRRYEIEVDPKMLPHEYTPYQPTDMGAHGFGRVPFERLSLPEGLWAMGKLHSLAREHLNKRCAMSWAEYKSLFSILYEFLRTQGAGGLPEVGIAADEDRAVSQRRGQGYSQIRDEKDRAEWIGPPVDPFVAARESTNDTMREMHRVMYSMAMSANMDSAALQRSGDSKASDQSTTEVLLDAIGQILLKFARRLFVLVALGRGAAPPKPYISGLAKFDTIGIDTKIAEAVQLFAGVPMLSALVKELYLAQLYFDLIGECTQAQRETIRQQIRDGLSMEEMAAAALAGMGPADSGPGAPGADDEGDNESPTPPAKPKPSATPGAPARLTMTRSSPRAKRR